MYCVEVDQDEELCPEDYYYWSEEGSGEVEACEQTQFGCCPDGFTAAVDAHGTGCSSLTGRCEDSEFGCCPDGNTTAQGADFEGCPTQPCSQTMYGCCADGVRPAADNNGAGCDEMSEPSATTTTVTTTTSATTATTTVIEVERSDCASMEYECCLDGVKPASGPHFAGCPEYGSYTETCEDSPFGCCPDGISPAAGPFNAGCAYQRQIAGCFLLFCVYNLMFAYNIILNAVNMLKVWLVCLVSLINENKQKLVKTNKK